MKHLLVLSTILSGCVVPAQGQPEKKKAPVQFSMPCVLVAEAEGGTLERCENEEAICYIGDSIESYAISCHWKTK